MEKANSEIEILVGIKYKLAGEEKILQDVNFNELKTLLVNYISTMSIQEIVFDIEPKILGEYAQNEVRKQTREEYVEDWIGVFMKDAVLEINDSLAVSCPLFEDYWTVGSNASTVACLIKFIVEKKQKQEQEAIDKQIVKQFNKGPQLTVNPEKTTVSRSSILAWIAQNS